MCCGAFRLSKLPLDEHCHITMWRALEHYFKVSSLVGVEHREPLHKGHEGHARYLRINWLRWQHMPLRSIASPPRSAGLLRLRSS